MNRKALILSGLAIFSLAAAATQQGITLRRELKENGTEVYLMETDMKQTVSVPTLGDQDMGLTSTAKMTLKTGKIDPATGEAQIDSTVSDIKTQGEGMMQAMVDQQSGSVPKEVKSSGKIDARNRMKMVSQKTAGAAQMFMSASNAAASMVFVEFPEKPVNVGDTWTVSLPKSPVFGNKPADLTAKFVGEKDYQGAKAWAISVAGTVSLDADISEMMKGQANNPFEGQKVMLKGTIDITGEALIDKGSGRTLIYTTTSKSKTTTDLPGMGSLDATGSTKTKMVYQK